MERRWLKQIEDALEMHGIYVKDHEHGKKHAKLRIERDGIKGFLTVSVSPSDRRTLLNIVKTAKGVLNHPVVRK